MAKATADLDYAVHQTAIYKRLVREDATRTDEVTLWRDKVAEAQGAKSEGEGQLAAAQLAYESEIDGVNASVANIEAQLKEARYHLDNTTMRAPEDGRIVKPAGASWDGERHPARRRHRGSGPGRRPVRARHLFPRRT